MSKNLVPGATLPDFALPDDTGTPRRLSELQEDEVMVLLLSRGEHCPRERQHMREMVKFHEWCAVAYTRLVTILPNELHDAHKLRISSGAYWPFLADPERIVQRTLEIEEYTDPAHNPMVPHTLVLSPGLRIEKVYVGYWFWGRPSAYQLWQDLGELFRRIKDDFDPTIPEARAAWEASHALAMAPSENGHTRRATKRMVRHST